MALGRLDAPRALGQRVAVQPAAHVPPGVADPVVRLRVDRREVPRLDQREVLPVAGPDVEVVLEGGLLRVEQLSRPDAGDHPHADPLPVVDDELRRPGRREAAEVQVEQHPAAVAERPAALVVALRQADLVQQPVRLVRVVLREALVEPGLVEVRGRAGGVLGRDGLPVELRVDDVPAVDCQREPLAEALLGEQLVPPDGHRAVGVGLAVEVRADDEAAAVPGVPVHHVVGAVAASSLAHQQRVLVVPQVAGLHGDLAVGGADGDHVLALDVEVQPVDVGELVALRVHHPVVRVADEAVRRVGAERSVDPRPETRVLGVVGALHRSIDGQRAGELPGRHRPGDQRLVADVRMILPQVVLRAGDDERSVVRRELRQEEPVGPAERDAKPQVVDLLNAAALAAGHHQAGDRAGDQLVVDLVPPPVEDVVGRERPAVRPLHPLAEREGERPVVRRDLVAPGHVRHERVSVRRPADERAGRHAMADHAEDVVVAVADADPRAAVLARPVDALDDGGLLADALGHRRQLPLADQLGQDGRFALGVPRGIGAIAVVHPAVEDDRVVRVDRGVPRLLGGADRLRRMRGRRGGHVRAHQPRHAAQRARHRDRRREKAQQGDKRALLHDTVFNRPRRPRGRGLARLGCNHVTRNPADGQRAKPLRRRRVRKVILDRPRVLVLAFLT